MLQRQKTNRDEENMIQNFIDMIGFTKYHYLVFSVGALILIANGMQVILQAFLVSLLSTIEEINLYDLAVINFAENIGYSIAYIIIMFYGKTYKNKLTIQILSVLCLISNGLGIFIFNFKFAIINRLFIGIFLGSLDLLIFVMLLEMCASKIRGFMSCIILVFNPLGQVISSLIAFWSLDEENIENNYKMLLKVPFFILLIVVILVIFLQESPRSLFEEKNYEKGINVYTSNNKVANFMRKRTIDRLDEEKDKDNVSQFESIVDNLNFSDLFNHSSINYTLVIVTFSLLAGFIYNGVYFLLPTNAPKLSKPEVSKLLLSVFIDIPSNICVSMMIETNYFGRIKSIMVGWVIAIIFSIGSAIFQNNIICMVMVKFGIAISISAIIVYACELYPKNLRTSIVSLINLGRRISTMIAPFVVSYITDRLEEKYVYVLFAIISMINLALNFSLKIETKDMILDDLAILSYTPN